MREKEKKFVKGGDFSPKAKKIIIMDSYNNDFYPLKSITLDKGTSKRYLIDEFRKTYVWSKAEIFFPWHYLVELRDREIQVTTTRPHNYNIVDLEPGLKDNIVIMIVGDSNSDIYIPEIYKKIVSLCIHPYTKARVNHINHQNIEYHNLGLGFSQDQIKKHL